MNEAALKLGVKFKIIVQTEIDLFSCKIIFSVFHSRVIEHTSEHILNILLSEPFVLPVFQCLVDRA